MRSAVKYAIIWLLSAATLGGQSLFVPRSETGTDTPRVFVVVMESPQGKAPVALQWELLVPPALTIKKEEIKIGKAGEAARKCLTCAVNTKKPVLAGAMRYACILAGGQASIENGPIAVIRYGMREDVGSAPIRVAIENVLGVSRDLKRIDIPNVDAIILNPR